jgi:Family of unknown function (DUF6812)
MDLRHERISFVTDLHRIVGKISLPRDGYRSRLSDYLKQRDREFIPIEDVEIRPLASPDEVQHSDFLLLNRGHVRFIAPLDGA